MKGGRNVAPELAEVGSVIKREGFVCGCDGGHLSAGGPNAADNSAGCEAVAQQRMHCPIPRHVCERLECFDAAYNMKRACVSGTVYGKCIKKHCGPEFLRKQWKNKQNHHFPLYQKNIVFTWFL